MKANIFSASKHKTPLQYACSLGLYLIVARLLKEGANPDLLPQGKDRSQFIDYGELPIDIVMNPKHHNQDLGLEGITLTRRYDRKDVDYCLCLKLLL